jgi:hypothetical protein
MFVPLDTRLEPSTPVTIRFKIEENQVVAHAEVRRVHSQASALERGIPNAKPGIEMRIVRMEGDGSQLLAEHIRKIMMESGGPA